MNITAVQKKTVLSMYGNPIISVDEICSKTKLSRSQVTQIAKDNNLTIRTAGRMSSAVRLLANSKEGKEMRKQFAIFIGKNGLAAGCKKFNVAPSASRKLLDQIRAEKTPGVKLVFDHRERVVPQNSPLHKVYTNLAVITKRLNDKGESVTSVASDFKVSPAAIRTAVQATQ